MLFKRLIFNMRWSRIYYFLLSFGKTRTNDYTFLSNSSVLCLRKLLFIPSSGIASILWFVLTYAIQVRAHVSYTFPLNYIFGSPVYLLIIRPLDQCRLLKFRSYSRCVHSKRRGNCFQGSLNE